MSENTAPRRMGKNVAGVVKALVEPVAEELGYFITIDNEEGITIEDCEKLHRAIDPVLDEADPIEEAYYLEVSSPGIERELKNEMHISACEGWPVEVKLYAPVNGSKVFKGTLCECPEGKIIIRCGENEMEFESASVAKINTVYEFGADN